MAYVERNLDTIPFKTLRYDEHDLSPADKLAQMRHTLRTDPGLFLSRWGRHLSQNSLRCFESSRVADYEVDFYLSRLLDRSPPSASSNVRLRSSLRQVAQNRRYQYLRRVLRGSEYFSDDVVQLREPVLYEQYVARYVPVLEQKKPFEDDVTLVDRILSNIDRKYVAEQVQQQKVKEDEQFEEEEDEQSEEEEEPSITTLKGKEKSVKMDDSQDDDDEEEEIEDLVEFREQKRLELIRLLEEQFLAGKDKASLDYNEEYDDLQQQEQDIQDKYFDED
ncbi:MAG: coiled-coil domain-containing protein-domain-containing protein [Benjaminiella poitrasii]|nr:MAG: coiled-coil domain-containing protein-domain-containing protein [Benjaminiella poitrasii]